MFRGDVDLFDTFVQEMDAFLQRFTLGLSSNRPKDNAVTTSNFRFPVRWHRLGGIGSGECSLRELLNPASLAFLTYPSSLGPAGTFPRSA